MAVPEHPKIYHIVHVDRLSSILSDGALYCDALMLNHAPAGTVIGMSSIKQRRLGLQLSSRPGLAVGSCVPFYFCSRSVMLYIISRGDHPEVAYRGGQGPIIHLEADLREAVDWADRNSVRWAFTLSNAGSYYFEDRASLDNLHEIDWDAVQAHQWAGRREAKQAEFLMEYSFPWHLVRRVGVRSRDIAQRVADAGRGFCDMPPIQILPGWYY
jgi:hypothetical protein